MAVRIEAPGHRMTRSGAQLGWPSCGCSDSGVDARAVAGEGTLDRGAQLRRVLELGQTLADGAHHAVLVQPQPGEDAVRSALGQEGPGDAAVDDRGTGPERQ